MLYMSFCDSDLPQGTQFLGAVMVSAPDLPRAVSALMPFGIRSPCRPLERNDGLEHFGR